METKLFVTIKGIEDQTHDQSPLGGKGIGWSVDTRGEIIVRDT